MNAEKSAVIWLPSRPNDVTSHDQLNHRPYIGVSLSSYYGRVLSTLHVQNLQPILIKYFLLLSLILV